MPKFDEQFTKVRLEDSCFSLGTKQSPPDKSHSLSIVPIYSTRVKLLEGELLYIAGQNRKSIKGHNKDGFNF